MLARVFSCTVIGLEGIIIEVEVDAGQGLPSIVVVRLPDAAVQETQSAIKNTGLVLPRNRVTVNLAPAAVRKKGPADNLPIAVSMLITTGQLAPDWVENALIVGELSLDGSVRHVRGVLPIAALARDKSYQQMFIPKVDAAEPTLT